MQRVPFEPPTDHYDKLVFIECKIPFQKPTGFEFTIQYNKGCVSTIS